MRKKRSLGNVIIAAACLLTLAFAESGRAEGKPAMTARLDLLERTYPRPIRVSTSRPPGPLLYVGHVDLGGTILWSGPAEFVQGIHRDLHAVQGDSEGLAKLLLVHLSRLNKDRIMVEIPGAAKGITVRLPDKPPEAQGVYECTFSIPVVLGDMWTEGQYRLDMGTWYQEGRAKRTVGTGFLFFEIKKVAKGSGDEINLLSNALLGKPKGLWAELARLDDYAKIHPAERILQIDPQDAWAKEAKYRQAMQMDAMPEKALAYWREIEQDFKAGKAHRIEAVLGYYGNPRYGHGPSPSPEFIKQMLAARTTVIEQAVVLSKEARTRIEALVKRGDKEALISHIRTKDNETLWSRGNVWPSVWAIRLAGNNKIRETREPLLGELAKLPPIPALFQKLIVNALAQIQGNDKRIGPGTPYEEQVEVVKWWLADHTQQHK